MSGSILAATESEIQWSMIWFLVFVLFLVELALFVLAVVRWEMNSWKYVLLVAGFLLPMFGAVAGWIALFAEAEAAGYRNRSSDVFSGRQCSAVPCFSALG